MFCIIFFYLFVLFMSMHFKTQKLDIVLKRIHHDLSLALTIRYRRAEVLAKVLLSIDIPSLIFNVNFHLLLLAKHKIGYIGISIACFTNTQFHTETYRKVHHLEICRVIVDIWIKTMRLLMIRN
jgi:hypothetical protein